MGKSISRHGILSLCRRFADEEGPLTDQLVPRWLDEASIEGVVEVGGSFPIVLV